MSAIDDVAAERRRQIEVEGWSPDHDSTHSSGEMAQAAACYAAGEPIFKAIDNGDPGYERFINYLPFWPWANFWWKPQDRRRDLIRAAALIVAEIERLDHTSLTKPDWSR